MTEGDKNSFRKWTGSPWRLVGIGFSLAALVGAAGLAYAWAGSSSQRYRLAWISVKQGDLDQARRVAGELRDAPGGDPLAGLIEGAVALRRRKLNEVFEPLQRARSSRELLPQILSLEGEALVLGGRRQEGATALAMALEANPDLPDPHRFLGGLYYDVGDTERVMQHLTRAAELAPRNPGPHFLMGHMLVEQGEFARAEECYRESLRRSPHQEDRPVILQELAQAQLAQGRPPDARQTLALCEPSPAIDALIAHCYRAEGDKSQALDYAERVLRAAPGNGDMLMLKGSIALEQLDGDVAFDAFARAVEAHRRSEAAHRGYSQAYMLLGDKKGADEETRIADEIHSQWDRYRALAEATDKDPTNVDQRFELAQLARQLDEPDLALEWLREIMQIDPNHGPTREALGLNASNPTSTAGPNDERGPPEPPTGEQRPSPESPSNAPATTTEPSLPKGESAQP